MGNLKLVYIAIFFSVSLMYTIFLSDRISNFELLSQNKLILFPVSSIPDPIVGY